MVWNIFYFSIYWECHHPNWPTHIFQRVSNHQKKSIAENTTFDSCCHASEVSQGDHLIAAARKVRNLWPLRSGEWPMVTPQFMWYGDIPTVIQWIVKSEFHQLIDGLSHDLQAFNHMNATAQGARLNSILAWYESGMTVEVRIPNSWLGCNRRYHLGYLT